MVRAFRSTWASFAVLGLILSPLLSACGGGDTVQEALGYEQTGPDEMAVIKRPPLIVPPDYNLRPPKPGEQTAADRAAASEAARKTLLGPSSSIEGEANDARAVLTGGGTANGASTSEAKSEGQNLLISRTDRAERDLDELTETRAENRVDGALLRRLLAWTPADRPALAEGEEAVAVQVVSRAQTPIDELADPDQTSAE